MNKLNQIADTLSGWLTPKKKKKAPVDPLDEPKDSKTKQVQDSFNKKLHIPQPKKY